MIVKSTIQTYFDDGPNKMAVSLSTEQVVDNTEEAQSFGELSAQLSSAFFKGYGEAEL